MKNSDDSPAPDGCQRRLVRSRFLSRRRFMEFVKSGKLTAEEEKWVRERQRNQQRDLRPMTAKEIEHMPPALRILAAEIKSPDHIPAMCLRDAAAMIESLVHAIRETLMENLHLADGDICTLKRLKDAIGFELPPANTPK